MRYKQPLLSIIIILLIVWSGFSISAYFVVQKPLALQITDHLVSLVWSIIVTIILMVNALGLGEFTIRFVLKDTPKNISMLILAGGLGLGELGLLGFFLAATGTASFVMLLIIQLFLLGWFIWCGTITEIIGQSKNLLSHIWVSGTQVQAWMRYVAGIGLALTLIMTLLPPVEAYDALLYHLTVPALWLRDHGLYAYNIPPYWFPSLVEGSYVWGLGLRSEIVPQQIHFLWALCTAILLWLWAEEAWNEQTAWWVWVLLVSMPSLPLLASWAYTDMALTFFSVATLYTLSKGRESNNTSWWALSGIVAGMAMGVKYTSVIVPLCAVIIITAWKFRQPKEWFTEILRFGMIACITGCVWYLRNWIWTGNPFYPFVFGGRYWDDFRSLWYAGVGTGAGWNIKALASLPLTITLGYQDITGFDADIGPLFLLLLPATLAIFTRMNHSKSNQRRILVIIAIFTFLSASFWTYGYITTKNLWQARLLFPAVILFTIPSALGILSIKSLDTNKLRVSLILTSIAAISIFVNLLDISLSVIARNPFAIATGIVSHEEYMEKYQPGYRFALQLIAETPQDSRIYSLFEPRSYGASRNIQPDALLDNFPHDVFIYKDPDTIIKAWQAEGYTHILLNIRGAHFILENTETETILEKTVHLLKQISSAPDGTYTLYEIPLH